MTDRGGLRLEIRVALIEYERFGRPLHFRQAGDLKLFECGNAQCRAVYKSRMVTVPGRAPMLALVMDRGWLTHPRSLFSSLPVRLT